MCLILFVLAWNFDVIVGWFSKGEGESTSEGEERGAVREKERGAMREKERDSGAGFEIKFVWVGIGIWVYGFADFIGIKKKDVHEGKNILERMEENENYKTHIWSEEKKSNWSSLSFFHVWTRRVREREIYIFR